MARLCWCPPARRGFGYRVLDRTVRGQLGGTLALAWMPEGLVCEIGIPLRRGRPEGESVGNEVAPWG